MAVAVGAGGDGGGTGGARAGGAGSEGAARGAARAARDGGRGAIARLEVAVGGGAEELHDLDQVLLRRVLALVRQVAEEELHQDRAHRPDVDADGVLGRAEHELGRAVVPRADVRHVGLPLHQHLRAPEVAQPALERRRVAEQVVRLDVAVADAPRVDVLERAERLPQVGADVVDGEALRAACGAGGRPSGSSRAGSPSRGGGRSRPSSAPASRSSGAASRRSRGPSPSSSAARGCGTAGRAAPS